MKTKYPSKTNTAFFALLLHPIYAALFAFFMWIASMLEVPCDRDGIYLVFAVISIALLCFYPIVTTGVNAISIVFQVLALIQKESKIKNIIMMVIAVLIEVAIVIISVRFWIGAMGV